MRKFCLSSIAEEIEHAGLRTGEKKRYKTRNQGEFD